MNKKTAAKVELAIKTEGEKRKRLPYKPPLIVTRTDDELLNMMGPALAFETGAIPDDGHF